MDRISRCLDDGTCKCGLLFIQKHDPLSRAISRVSGCNYTWGGFYCRSSIPPHDMFILIDPLGNFEPLNSLADITRDPAVTKVVVRELKDAQMKAIFHEAISSSVHKREPTEILNKMFCKGFVTDVIDGTVEKMNNLVPHRNPTLPDRNIDVTTLRSNEPRSPRCEFFSDDKVIYQREINETLAEDDSLAVLLMNELSSNPNFRQAINVKFDKPE